MLEEWVWIPSMSNQPPAWLGNYRKNYPASLTDAKRPVTAYAVSTQCDRGVLDEHEELDSTTHV